jgi:hypothetical protein
MVRFKLGVVIFNFVIEFEVLAALDLSEEQNGRKCNF